MPIALPSWLQPADEAQYRAEGLRIGDAEAQQRAVQSERQQAGQRDEQELQMRQQQLEQQATQAAQKYQAQQSYSQFLAAGGDPIQAILKFGPAMGQGADVGAAIRAQQMNRPKPALPAPAIQMQPGPDGTQIPLLVQGGKASVVPRSAYTAPVQEQWTPGVDEQGFRGQRSSKSNRFIYDPSNDQPGAMTKQQSLEVSVAKTAKVALQKKLEDGWGLTKEAQKRSKSGIATVADKDAVRAEIQKKIDALDKQIKSLAGSSLAAVSDTADDGEAKTIKFTRDSDGNLVPATADADSR